MTIRRFFPLVFLPIILAGLLAFCLICREKPVKITVTDPGYRPGVVSSVSPDPNTASRDALMALPGVGEKTADAIITYREQYGPFSDVRELILVPGIGESKIADILAYYEITD